MLQVRVLHVFYRPNSNLQREEILKQLLPGLRQDRLGMKLDTFELMASMPHAHDDPVIRLRGDRQFPRQRLSLHNKRVIPSSGKGIG